jgi:hypothetical protein
MQSCFLVALTLGIPSPGHVNYHLAQHYLKQENNAQFAMYLRLVRGSLEKLLRQN